ncbi:hypothetical protein S40285_06715 [Stachybotrys chlorohalonatus IBT 40285]|uniref:Glucanase n=1 Tax=Stachybotrys chlorohalonatus (strain IBT 40285) TaxID=1283841 RepID=A0A084QTH2_STAC4|nr:hypothetical protein S40285_06715 [Stachybotrys chlorohalonata IBT 40285]
MRVSTLVAGLSAAGSAAALPFEPQSHALRSRLPSLHKPFPIKARQEANPWTDRRLLPNPSWAAKLESAYTTFAEAGDEVNAGKVRTIQQLGTFYWVSNIASLPSIDTAIADARAFRDATGEQPVVGLVLYNLPDRDCSAGESAGELDSTRGGEERYRTEFVDVYYDKVSAADDLTFAIVLEPDSLANLVTNMGVELCARAEPVYKRGIAYAVSKLQLPNVHLYIDAAHGGWLGWADNLAPSAAIYAEVLELARNQTGPATKIRGFSTNVSNYNPLHATVRENYTEWSPSWDEAHYASSLAPFLEDQGLPARFIVDQGRVALPGAREAWGEWCNVSPAGFGLPPSSEGLDSEYLDSVVWVKPGGESDGRCGFEGAPAAGQWHNEYVVHLVENAHPSILPAE